MVILNVFYVAMICIFIYLIGEVLNNKFELKGINIIL
jgi:hypothetical protein